MFMNPAVSVNYQQKPCCLMLNLNHNPRNKQVTLKRERRETKNKCF
jgi:hypothetical protein